MTTIVLAAGRSQRFGWANKLCARIDGRPLIVVTLGHVLAATRGPVVLVIDHQAHRLQRVLARHGVVSNRLRIVYAPGARHDMARSRAHGMAAAPRLSSAVQIHLADVPGFRARRVARLRRAMRDGALAGRLVYRGCPGHPVRFRADHIAANGDFRQALAALPASAWAYVAGSRDCIRDIDRRRMMRDRGCE